MEGAHYLPHVMCALLSSPPPPEGMVAQQYEAPQHYDSSTVTSVLFPDLHQSQDHFPFVPQQQQQSQQEVIPAPTFDTYQTEPTEPGPLDCREEQYPCTRLYSVHKPCKQCLQGICLYSLRRMYVINKEICTRMVCQHDELLRGERGGGA
ncbi:PREDICTED: microfibrillar-associated protein 2 [Nanorana parkeri]|uniref:microfibrillar-associated protein 2 n=1 Tax=Nanorana parkeri TaxID=125878 RepID=UPI00085443D6|nr:PREDICTED: microfibrillar-associated protein 2 [Nanorana parkeri]